MASLCRSAAIAAVRSAAVRSKTLLPSSFPSKRSALLTSRSFVSALGTVESLMPLHNAIASSRLRSSIGIDTSRWSCLSQVTNMSFSTICRRASLKELVSNPPVYTSTSVASGGLNLLFRRWATKKTAGSTKNGRDSNPQFLGVKKFGGERVIPGNIIVRQRGTRFHPGDYVGIGKDHTLFALKEGKVRFEQNKLTGRKWVHVDPKEGHVLHPLYAAAASTESIDGRNQLYLVKNI